MSRAKGEGASRRQEELVLDFSGVVKCMKYAKIHIMRTITLVAMWGSQQTIPENSLSDVCLMPSGGDCHKYL